MGLKSFQILFDNQWGTYYCGQPVTGRVLLNIDAPKKIRGIVIHFKGESATKWDESTKTKNNEGQDVTETIDYIGNEVYFENKYNIVGGSTGESTLQPGEHCYPFNTVLPPNLPSSFEGEYGHVRYTVKVTLDRPWKFDQEAKAAFTVISPLDLNLHPTAKDPVKLTEEKFFCCCCCKSGPLTLVVSLPCSGYVSGQQIPCTVEVDNISQQEISNVTITLRKHLTFTATSPNKSEKRDRVTIAEINLGSVGKNGSQTWREVFPIPPLPPSNLAHCGLIDLNYDLKIKGKVSGMLHRNVEITIPLVLGTIPLTNFQPPAPMLGGVGDGKVPGVAAPTGVEVPIAGAGWGVQPPGQGQPMYPTQPPAGSDPVPQGMQPPPGSGYPGMPPQGTGYPGMPPQGTGYPGMPPQVTPPQGLGYPGIPPQSQGYPGMPPAENDGQPGALYPSLPPPSFAEASTGAKNIQDAGDSKYMQGNLDFTPRYPVYNYPNPYAPPTQ